MERLTVRTHGTIAEELVEEMGNPIDSVFVEKSRYKDCRTICAENADCDNCPLYEVMRKLADYEDAEENGMLIHLQSKDVYESSGGYVYYIYDYEIVECVNCGLTIDADGKPWIGLACDDDIFPCRRPLPGIDLEPADWCTNVTDVKLEEWGKTVFLTREAAEQALAKMEGV